MANRTLTADVIAKAALPILENELGVLGTLYRAHEAEFTKKVNGYGVGETISIRRPADFTIRSGAVASAQDVIEGKVDLTVDQQKGVDFKFTTTDLTLRVEDLADRVIKPAVANLVHDIARDVFQVMYRGIYNWVGAPGQTINSFADFSKGPERLDEMSVPMDSRHAVLSPPDHWAMLGSNTGLFVQDAAKSALRHARLGMIGGIETWMSQVVPAHTNGDADDTSAVVDGGGSPQSTDYDSAKDSWTMTLNTAGWNTNATISAGTVFTIDGVNMVNPKTKQDTGIAQQFVVVADASSDGSGDAALTIAPPIIASGPHQTVAAAAADSAGIDIHGDASTAYKQNMMYHRNAMALAVVPREIPAGSVDVSRQTRNGISVMVEPVRDGINDTSLWRLDVLYGRKLIDPRLATRVSGTA